MTKLSGKMWVFVHIGIHNTSRKFHLSKLYFTKIKTNNIRMKTMTLIFIIKIKTRVDTNINIAIFRFNHKSFSSKKRKLRGKNCKITSEKTNFPM